MILNTYRALFKENNETKTIFCNASSLIKAIELLQPNENSEPYQISLVHENTLTEPTTETHVSFSAIFVNEDGEPLQEDVGNIYPSILNNVKRGSIIYVMGVPNENYDFVKWIDFKSQESEENPLQIIVPTDESFTELICKMVVKRKTI